MIIDECTPALLAIGVSIMSYILGLITGQAREKKRQMKDRKRGD